MKVFGIYTFAFKKAAPKSAILAYSGNEDLQDDTVVELGNGIASINWDL